MVGLGVPGWIYQKTTQDAIARKHHQDDAFFNIFSDVGNPIICHRLVCQDARFWCSALMDFDANANGILLLMVWKKSGEAPVDTDHIPLFTRFRSHPRWCRISEPSTVGPVIFLSDARNLYPTEKDVWNYETPSFVPRIFELSTGHEVFSKLFQELFFSLNRTQTVDVIDWLHHRKFNNLEHQQKSLTPKKTKKRHRFWTSSFFTLPYQTFGKQLQVLRHQKKPCCWFLEEALLVAFRAAHCDFWTTSRWNHLKPPVVLIEHIIFLGGGHGSSSSCSRHTMVNGSRAVCHRWLNIWKSNSGVRPTRVEKIITLPELL